MVIELRLFLQARARGNIDFAADERLHPGPESLFVKIDDAEHGPVIGDCHRGHLQLSGPPDQLLDPGRSVEEAVFCVAV